MPVRQCTYSKYNHGCFDEESPLDAGFLARLFLCTARVCKTSDALRSSELTTLRGYATQHSILRVPATQLILLCHMHRKGRIDSFNAEAMDVQPIDAQAVVEPGRRVGVVLKRFSNGFIIKTIVFHP